MALFLSKVSGKVCEYVKCRSGEHHPSPLQDRISRVSHRETIPWRWHHTCEIAVQSQEWVQAPPECLESVLSLGRDDLTWEYLQSFCNVLLPICYWCPRILVLATRCYVFSPFSFSTQHARDRHHAGQSGLFSEEAALGWGQGRCRFLSLSADSLHFYYRTLPDGLSSAGSRSIWWLCTKQI